MLDFKYTGLILMTKEGRFGRARRYYESMQSGKVTKEFYDARIAEIFKGVPEELEAHLKAMSEISKVG